MGVYKKREDPWANQPSELESLIRQRQEQRNVARSYDPEPEPEVKFEDLTPQQQVEALKARIIDLEWNHSLANQTIRSQSAELHELKTKTDEQKRAEVLEEVERRIQAAIDPFVREHAELNKQIRQARATLEKTRSSNMQISLELKSTRHQNQTLQTENQALTKELEPHRAQAAEEQAKLEAEQRERDAFIEAQRKERLQLALDHAEQDRLSRARVEEARQTRIQQYLALSNEKKLEALLSESVPDVQSGESLSHTQRRENAIQFLMGFPEETRAELLVEIAKGDAEEANWLVQKTSIRTNNLVLKVLKAVSSGPAMQNMPNPKSVSLERTQQLVSDVMDDLSMGGSSFIGQRFKDFTNDEREAVLIYCVEKVPKVALRLKEQYHFEPVTLGQREEDKSTAEAEPVLEAGEPLESIEAPRNELEPQNFSNSASGQLEPSMEQQQGQRVNTRLEPTAQNLTSIKEKSGFIDRSDGAFIRSSPEVNGIIKGKLESADAVSILGQYRANGGWVYVQGITKGAVVSGWMAKDRLETQKPEPRAKLHHVKSGETPEGLARANFRDAAQPGMDYRFYVNALIYVNEQDKRDGIQAPLLPFTTPQLEAGKRIWLLSPEFAMSLKGVVGSGSITGGAFAKAREQSTVLPDTLESVALALQLGDDVMQKDIWNALDEHWLEILGMTTLFVGAEVATIALTAAPEPALTKVAAAAILQSILAGFAAYGVVTATQGALSEGQQWLETASNAKGNPKEIKKAAIHLVRMLENVGMALLATVQGNANGQKSLELSKNFKLPKMPGLQPQAVTPEGVQINVPEQQPQLQNQTSRTGRLEITPASALRINSHRGVLERIFPREAIAKAPAEIKAKALKIREGAEDLIDAAEKAAKKNPKGQDAILEKLDKDLRNYFEKVDTDNGRIRLNNNEIIFRDRSSAIAEAKKRAGIPENAKPVDSWEVGGDQKLAEMAKQNTTEYDAGKPVPDYVQKPDKGAWGRYEVYEVRVNGKLTRHGIVDHTDDPNNFLRHVHAVKFDAEIPKWKLRHDNYIEIDNIKHHLAYQEAK
jgi:hypothetical protein